MASRAVCECGWRGRCRTPLAAAEEAFDHQTFHWLEESCRAQGIPLRVTNPRILQQVAVLLGVYAWDSQGSSRRP